MTKISIQADKKSKELVLKDKKQIIVDKKKLAADKKKLAADKKKIAAEAREAKKKAASELREKKKKATEAKKKERAQARAQAEAKKQAVGKDGMGVGKASLAGGAGGILGGGGGAVIINNVPKQAPRARATKTATKQAINPILASVAARAPNVNVINTLPTMQQQPTQAFIPPTTAPTTAPAAPMPTSTGGLMSTNESVLESEPLPEPMTTESMPTIQPMAIRAPPERLLIGNELDLPTPGDSGRTVSDSSMFNFETPTGSSLDEIQIPASFTDRQMIEIADAQSQTDNMNADMGMQTDTMQSDIMNADMETQTTPIATPIELLIGEPQRTSTGTQTEMDVPQKLLGNPPRTQTSSRIIGPTDLDILRVEATQARERMRIAEIIREAELRENKKRLEELKEADRLKTTEEHKKELKDLLKDVERSNLLKNTLVPDIDEGVEKDSDEASSSRTVKSSEPALEPVEQTVQAQAEPVEQISVPDSTKLNLKTSSEGKKFAEKHGLAVGQEVFLLATLDVNSNDGFRFDIFDSSGRKLKKTTLNEMRNIFKIPEASKQMERHGKIIKNMEIRDKYVG